MKPDIKFKLQIYDLIISFSLSQYLSHARTHTSAQKIVRIVLKAYRHIIFFNEVNQKSVDSVDFGNAHL